MNFGIKTSYDDIDKIIGKMKYVEIQMLEKDMKRLEKLSEKFSTMNIEFVIHPPFEIDGIHFDLCGKDRKNWIDRMKKIIKFADSINARYVIAHPAARTAYPADLESFKRNLIRSLEEIASDNIILETMPWFYHVNGKKFFSNILLKPEDFYFFEDFAAGICLDTCHTFLGTNPGSTKNVLNFIKELKSKIKHFHMVDAKSPDIEGLQIGRGEIDFPFVMKKIKNISAMAVPEIMDGHKNNGAEFYRALEILKRML